MKIYTEQTKKNILIFKAIQMQKKISKEIANFFFLHIYKICSQLQMHYSWGSSTPSYFLFDILDKNKYSTESESQRDYWKLSIEKRTCIQKDKITLK